MIHRTIARHPDSRRHLQKPDDADSDLEEPSEEPAEEATNSIPMTLQGEPVDRGGIDWTFWRGPASNRISSETGLVDGWDPNGIVR